MRFKYIGWKWIFVDLGSISYFGFFLYFKEILLGINIVIEYKNGGSINILNWESKVIIIV